MSIPQFTEYRVGADELWTAAQMSGGDGYDRVVIVKQDGWRAAYDWGRDGWDIGDPPYVIVYHRETEDA